MIGQFKKINKKIDKNKNMTSLLKEG